jgi:hypothetical protein
MEPDRPTAVPRTAASRSATVDDAAALEPAAASHAACARERRLSAQSEHGTRRPHADRPMVEVPNTEARNLKPRSTPYPT